MIEPEREEFERGPLGSIQGGVPDEASLLDVLAAQRKELSENRETEISIPGYERGGFALFARYRLLSGPELEAIMRRVQKEYKKQYDRNLYGSVDVFIEACLGFSVEMPDGDRRPLTYQGAPIIGYNEDLAAALRFEPAPNPRERSRSIVFGTFGNNVVAIGQHNLSLGRWMGNTNIEIDEEIFLGNP